jgi:transposase
MPTQTANHYVGLDVSQELTAVCVVDEDGQIVWRGACATDAGALVETVRKHAPLAVRIGLETGQFSNWLTLSLRRRGLPVVCVDARHAKAALEMQINKTDANEAHGLAQVVRTGWYREVTVKSMDASALRMLLVARAQLVMQRQAIANTLRGLMKALGIVVLRGATGRFPVRVREAVEGNAALSAIAEPLLRAWQVLREEADIIERQLVARAEHDAVTRRLMTVPGVGVIVALAFQSVIDTPDRFRRSESVGAYIGLTPKRYQSGEVDVSGRISRCCDGLLRAYLFEAANVLMQPNRKASALRSWGLKRADRLGRKRAKVALARKLAVVMHRIWANGTDYCGDAVTANAF